MAQKINLEKQAQPEHLGFRLDKTVSELFSDYSRSRLKEWLLEGRVKVNGEVVSIPNNLLLENVVVCKKP